MPEDESPQRRQFPRKRCAVPVQLRAAGASYPMACHTIDLSLSGCYVRNLFTLPIATPVEIALSIGDTVVLVKGMVKTSDAALGNGIAFAKFEGDGRAKLQQHLDGIDHDDSTAVTIIR